MNLIALDPASLAGWLHDAEPDGACEWNVRATIRGRIGWIPVRGLLVSDVDTACRGWRAATAYTAIARAVVQLGEAYERGEIDRVVLAIDSPGGYVSGALDCAATIEQSPAPIEAYVTGMACSMAYLLAASCGRVIASPMAYTASIGTVIHARSDRKMLADIGITEKVIRSVLTPDKALDPDDERYDATIRPLVESGTAAFLAYVAKRRGLTGDASAIAKATGEGAPIEAARALSMGLIDEVRVYDAAAGGMNTGAPSSTARPAMGQEGRMAQADENQGTPPPPPRGGLARMDGGGRLLVALGLRDDASLADAAGKVEGMLAEHKALAGRLAGYEREQRTAEADALLGRHAVPDALRGYLRDDIIEGGARAERARAALAQHGEVDQIAGLTADVDAACARGALAKGAGLDIIKAAKAAPASVVGMRATVRALPAGMVAAASPPPGGGVQPVDGGKTITDTEAAQQCLAASQAAIAKGEDGVAAHAAVLAEFAKQGITIIQGGRR